MSTVAQVRTAWNTNIMSDASVVAMTTNILDDPHTNDSRKEINRLRFNQEIHFIEFLVGRQETPGLIGAKRYKYSVELNYYYEKDPTGDNYTTAIDNISTIDDLVRTALTENWGGTVDFYSEPTNTPFADTVEISGKNVWKVTQTYEAEKVVSL